MIAPPHCVCMPTTSLPPVGFPGGGKREGAEEEEGATARKGGSKRISIQADA